jgi:myo-inositol-1(or 4)-monophosphatase
VKQTLLDKAEAAVIKVLRDVRPQLLAAYGQIEFTTKADGTSLTELDMLVERRLRDVLRPIAPGVGIVGEEVEREGTGDTYWLIDPIDGTEQFIRGMPSCKNLVTLMEGGQPVWALMYFFVSDNLWLARKGQGATKNGQRMQLRHRPLEKCWIEFINKFTPEDIRVGQALKERVKALSRFHDTSFLMDSCVDGIVSLRTNGGQWDYGPRVLIYEEMGGRFATLGQETFDFEHIAGGFVQCHGKNFDELHRIVLDAKNHSI